MPSWNWLNKILAFRTARPGRDTMARWPSVGSTAAGVRMTADIAFENAAFWAGHKYLTQTLAQLPGRVMLETRGGFAKRVLAHPVVNIFTWRANPEMSPFQLKETLTGWAITHGNGVAEIEPDMAGRVAALWPIHPDRVRFCRATEPMEDARGTPIAVDELYYEISNSDGGGNRTALAAGNVFHIRGFGNGPVGLSVVAYAAQSLGWARATEIFGSTFFGESLNPAGFIEVPGQMREPDQERLLAKLRRDHRGPHRSNKDVILDGGIKWTKRSIQPDEAQFLESMQFQVETICRWLGVPPQKVHHLLRMTFNNVEQLSIEVVVDTITPWAIRWEEECNFKLFGQNRQGFFVKFDLKGLLRGAFKERQEGLQVMRRNGVVNAEEWRELEDMGPMPDAAGGGTFIIEKAMVRLDQLGQDTSAQPAAPPDPQSNPDPLVPAGGDAAAAAALAVSASALGLREVVNV